MNFQVIYSLILIKENYGSGYRTHKRYLDFHTSIEYCINFAVLWWDKIFDFLLAFTDELITYFEACTKLK